MNTKRVISNEELDARIDTLETKVEKLEAKIDLVLIRTDELITSYNTAKGITVFIRWLASLATASGIVWALLHGKIPS